MPNQTWFRYCCLIVSVPPIFISFQSGCNGVSFLSHSLICTPVATGAVQMQLSIVADWTNLISCFAQSSINQSGKRQLTKNQHCGQHGVWRKDLLARELLFPANHTNSACVLGTDGICPWDKSAARTHATMTRDRSLLFLGAVFSLGFWGILSTQLSCVCVRA